MREKVVWYQAHPLTKNLVVEFPPGENPVPQLMETYITKHWCYKNEKHPYNNNHNINGENNETI